MMEIGAPHAFTDIRAKMNSLNTPWSSQPQRDKRSLHFDNHPYFATKSLGLQGYATTPGFGQIGSTPAFAWW